MEIIETTGSHGIVFPTTLFREVGMGSPNIEEEKFIKFLIDLPFIPHNFRNFPKRPRIYIYALQPFEMYGLWYICRDFSMRDIKKGKRDFFRYANDIEVYMAARNNLATVVTENKKDFLSISENNWENTRLGINPRIKVVDWEYFKKEIQQT